MTVVLTRWLAVALVAIGLGLAGLELSVCLAAERAAMSAASRPDLFTDDEPGLPSEAELDDSEVSASPRLTY